MIVRANGRAIVTKYGRNPIKRVVRYGTVYNERRIKSSSFIGPKQVFIVRNVYWLKKIAMLGTMIQSKYIISL